VGWYKNWFDSPYYKVLYQSRDELEAQEFVEKLVGYLQPPPGSTMLDIACGEGRYARQLAGHGFDVTGIDLSPSSIDAAKRMEQDGLHFYIHDMRMPFYINYFNYAFNFFTSFGYFAHDRDHALAARSFAASLKNEGLLVIDYLNANLAIANLVPEETVVRGDITFKISRRVEHKHIIKDISFIDADNQEQHYSERVAAFELADFIRMFKAANMSLVSTFGNYQLEQFNPIDSPRLIMIFKKKYA
jgi:2-polyprenyl-3-methyl-5-hydroxy-6-metoxy-1,4-benzoquinol methylase